MYPNTKLANPSHQQIIQAVEWGNVPLLQDYYQSGVQFDKVYNHWGDTLLHLAVLYNQPAALNALLSFNFDANSVNVYTGETALNTAAIFGQAQFIAPLVEHGANLNSLDGTGFSPLLNSICFDHYSTADTLLTYNDTNVNLSAYGFSPMLIAYYLEQWDLVESIVEHQSYDDTYNYIIANDAWNGGELLHYLDSTGHGGDKSYVEAFETLKFLGLRYDFDAGFCFANSQAYHMTFAFEGCINDIGLAGFFDAYLAFQDSVVSQAELTPIGLTMYQDVFEALAFSHGTLNPEDYLARYQQGLPVLIQSGWDAHSIVFVLHEDTLYRCNRGHLSAEGIEEFHIKHPENIDVNLIDFMIEAIGSPNYLQYSIVDLLGLEKIGAIEMPWQTVGNCVWTSLEAGLEALMVTSLLSQGLDSKTAHELAQNNFDLWKHFDLDYGLAECILHKDVLIEQGLYDDILVRILESNHDANDPYQIERGMLILNELSSPDHADTFTQAIGDLVYQYDNASFLDLEIMQGYEQELSLSDKIWNTTGLSYFTMSTEDYHLAREYYDFLLACEHFEASQDHFVLELHDIFTTHDAIQGLGDLKLSHGMETPSVESDVFMPMMMQALPETFEHELAFC